jgi:tripartite-type tricarboxylate transporter receptor subunit TctC
MTSFLFNKRARLLRLAATLSTLIALSGMAAAQPAWPTKPVRIVSPFPAGGTSDVMARMLAAGLTRELGQQVVVENIGGAGGTIGTLRALRAAPDGYTLIQTGVGQNAVAHGLDPKLAYDSRKDFIHISQVHTGPNVLVVHPDQPFKTFQELIAHVRSNPGRMNYGYTHAASGHMAMELLKQVGGENGKPLFIVGIPYRGGGPMMQDILGGQIPMMFINQDVALPHVRAGKLRPLAVTSRTRNPLYPDVPTIAETGVKGYEALSWSGISVAKGTPQAIVDKLEGAVRKVMSSPEIVQRMTSIGFVIPEQGSMAYAKFVGAEIDLWTRVIQTAGIKPQ